MAVAIPAFAAEEFVPLQEIPGFIEGGQEDDVPGFLNSAFRIGVGIAAILAVIVIIIGGFEYMTSDIPGNKSDGKERIRGAILGVAIILLSWIILGVINPDIRTFRIFQSGSSSGTEMAAGTCTVTWGGEVQGTVVYESQSICSANCSRSGCLERGINEVVCNESSFSCS